MNRIENGTFFGLQYLSYLYLQNNQFSKIDAFTFGGLNGLLILNLESNQIQSFANNSVISLISLENLCLFNNPRADTFKDACKLIQTCILNNVRKCDYY